MYAQHGEDLLLAKRFRGQRNGTFIEVGAYNGVELSNTCLLEREYGWKGVLVEPNPEKAAEAVLARPASSVVEVAAVAPAQKGIIGFAILEGFEPLSTIELTPHFRDRFIDSSGIPPVTHRQVRAQTLDTILADQQVTGVDVVSIDVEGHEDAVLRGFSLGSRWRPTVVLVERSRPFPSLYSVTYFLRSGYAYRFSIGANDWYEPGRLLSRLLGVVRLATHCVPLIVRATVRSILRNLGLLGWVRVWRQRNGFPRSSAGGRK